MTMRGQRLFVRPIETADRDAVRAFLEAHGEADSAPPAGLIGKLVGNLVAVLAMEVTPEAIRVDDLVVARELRRKQIGRVMLSATNSPMRMPVEKRSSRMTLSRTAQK